VARAVISDPRRRTAYEPLYDIDPQTGASVEVFYADRTLAMSFGMHGAGWFWWACQPACLPGGSPAHLQTTISHTATRWVASNLWRASASAPHPHCTCGHSADTAFPRNGLSYLSY